MRFSKKHFIIPTLLLGTSFIIYLLQFTIFHDSKDTFFYLFQDLAFLPISMLLVSFILDKMISDREKREKLEKMNMVIGVFFSEIGSELVRQCSNFDNEYEINKHKLCVTSKWTASDFDNAAALVKKHNFNINSKKASFDTLKSLLLAKRSFLLNLLGNPVLLEHDTFSDLLWSIFHIIDELSIRDKLANLTDEDYSHLSVDIDRMYGLLIYQWILYIKHIKNDYPYLFNLALKQHPYM